MSQTSGDCVSTAAARYSGCGVGRVPRGPQRGTWLLQAGRLHWGGDMGARPQSKLSGLCWHPDSADERLMFHFTYSFIPPFSSNRLTFNFFLPHLHKTFVGSGGVSVSHIMSHNSGYFVILSPVSAQHLDPQGQWAAFLLHVLPGTHL